MKIGRIVASLLLGISLCGAGAFAEDKPAATEKPKFREGSCCDKAAKAGNECKHPCCAAAAKDGKVCEKCNAPKKKEG